MAIQDDDVPRVFRLGYSAFAWASLLLTLVLTVAVMRTLFVTTPDGTTTTQAMARVAPTLTALVAAQPTRDPNAPTPVSVEVLKAKMAACGACHVLPELGFAGATCPDLSRVAVTAAEHLASAAYTGKAAKGDVAAYLRESLLEPGVYIVPGNNAYGTIGASLMPVKGGATLTDADVDMIVGYLMTRK